MNTHFFILFSVIISFQILLLLCNFKVKSVAKAGKVDKNYHFFKRLCWGIKNKYVLLDGMRIDVSSLETLFVKGNSMLNFGIKNNQVIYVEVFNSDVTKNTINDFPILVFNITNEINGYKLKIGDSKYKLRKFIGYIDSLENIDWHKIYDLFKDRISVSEAIFLEDCQKKALNFENKNIRYILSATFDETEQRIRYSLHPVTSVYGEVKYVA